jgi:hypothetical protein
VSKTFASIDEVLGSSESRYFGSGHTRVSYALSGHRITRSALCTATIDGSWSTKADGEAAPHTSTLDAVVLATHVAHRYFAEVLNYSPAEVGMLYLERAAVKAGSEPATMDGIAVEVQMEVPSTPGVPTDLAVNARVANMDVRLEFAEITPARSALDVARFDPSSSGGPWRSRQTKILDLVVDGSAGQISARASVDALPGHYAATRVQAPEALLIAAQVGQVLVYQHDEIDRAESDNLWMRRIDLRMEHSKPLGPGEITEVRGRIDRVRDVPLGGRVFRTFRVSGGSAHFSCAADIAHALPDRLAQGDRPGAEAAS